MARDPYAVLGVDPGASDAEITAAYRRLVRSLHPDTGPGRPADEERLGEVLAAYAELRDPARRAAAGTARRRDEYDCPRPARGTGATPLVVVDPDLRRPPPLWVGPVRVQPLGGRGGTSPRRES